MSGGDHGHTFLTNVFALGGFAEGVRWQLFACSAASADSADPVVASFQRLCARRVPCLWRWASAASAQPTPTLRTGGGNGGCGANAYTSPFAVAAPPTPALLLSQATPSQQQQQQQKAPQQMRELLVFLLSAQGGDSRGLCCKELIDPRLQFVEEGTWDARESPQLTDALFAALRNALSWEMHARSFLRVGSFFVRRCPAGTAFAPVAPRPGQAMVSVSFAFFLLGDAATVCVHATVQRRRLWPLLVPPNPRDASLASEMQVVMAGAGLWAICKGVSAASDVSSSDKDEEDEEEEDEWKALHGIAPALRSTPADGHSLKPCSATLQIALSCGFSPAVVSVPLECALVHVKPAPLFSAIFRQRTKTGMFWLPKEGTGLSPSQQVFEASAPDYWTFMPNLLMTTTSLSASYMDSGSFGMSRSPVAAMSPVGRTPLPAAFGAASTRMTPYAIAPSPHQVVPEAPSAPPKRIVLLRPQESFLPGRSYPLIPIVNIPAESPVRTPGTAHLSLFV